MEFDRVSMEDSGMGSEQTERATFELRVMITPALLERLDRYGSFEQRDRANSVRVLLDVGLRISEPITDAAARARVGPMLPRMAQG